MSWRRPNVPDEIEWSDARWWWHAGKVGHRTDDLFGSLHDRYNTAPMYIIQSEAFRLDVVECMREADDKADFHRLLQARRDQRLAQLHQYMDNSLPHGSSEEYPTLTLKQRLGLRGFLSYASLDKLAEFFHSLVGDYGYVGAPLPRHLRKFWRDPGAGLQPIDFGALHVPTPSAELRAELAHGFVDLDEEEAAEKSAAQDRGETQNQNNVSKTSMRDAGTQTFQEPLTQDMDSLRSTNTGETSPPSPEETAVVNRTTSRRKPEGRKRSGRVEKGTTSKPTRRSARQRNKMATRSQVMS